MSEKDIIKFEQTLYKILIIKFKYHLQNNSLKLMKI
jgi:hypothetical protein